jgi:hypothetical protein
MGLISISGKIGSGKDLTAQIIQALDWYYNGHKNSIKEKYTDIEYCLRVIKGDSMQYSEWQVKKFADKLKDIVCILLGCTREQLEDREFKEKELGKEWWVNKFGDDTIQTYHPNQNSNTLIKLTPRLLLQLIGTQCFRDIVHPDTWCNSLMNKYILSNETIYVYITGRWDCIGTFIRVLLDKEVEIGTKSLDENWIVDSGNLKDGYFLKPLKGQFQNEHRILKPGYRFSIYHKEEIYPNWILTDTRFPNELKAVKDRGGICIKINRSLYNYLDETYTWSELEKEVLKDTGERIFKSYADEVHLIKSDHASETALNHITDWDYKIDNNSTLEELIEKVKVILIKEKII